MTKRQSSQEQRPTIAHKIDAASFQTRDARAKAAADLSSKPHDNQKHPIAPDAPAFLPDDVSHGFAKLPQNKNFNHNNPGPGKYGSQLLTISRLRDRRGVLSGGAKAIQSNSHDFLKGPLIRHKHPPRDKMRATKGFDAVTGLLFYPPGARLTINQDDLSPIQGSVAYQLYAQFKKEMTGEEFEGAWTPAD